MTAIVDAGRRGGEATFEVRSPADGRVVAELMVHDPARVAAAAAELRQAQPAWEELGPDGRAAHLLNWLDWVMDNESRLVELVQAESGKSWGDALGEPATAVEVIRYAARNARRWLAPRHVRPHSPLHAGKRLRVQQLETGGVCVNNALVGAFQLGLPFSGWKSSGVGYRGGGRQAVLKYCRQRAFIAERVHVKKELNWYPYTPFRGRLISRVIRLVGMRDWRRRLGLAPRAR